MSNRPVIAVENLGKVYSLNRQAETQRYVALRDVIADKFRGLFRPSEAKSDKFISKEDFWALKDLNFEVRQGDVIGIIGRNGAGKSTLLKILSRITEPSKGRVRIRGRVASLLEVGTGFHPELTGRENIYLNGAILGMTRVEIKRKFDEIVDFAEIEKFLDTPVKRYSSGMYVRLAFAVAAHLEPEILVVDEVLAVGDAQFQKKCLGKMETVADRDGRTVLFVSHNVAAVRQLCKSALFLDQGKIRYQGSVDEGISHYLETVGMGDGTCRSVIEPKPKLDLPLYVKRASLLNLNVDTGEMSPNQSLKIRVEFMSTRPSRTVVVGMVFYDSEGRALLNLNNLYQPYTPLTVPCHSGSITCDLGMVPLMPGFYTISLWVGESEKNLQFIDHALTFKVTTCDTWEKGKAPPENISPLWWPTRFTLEPEIAS